MRMIWFILLVQVLKESVALEHCGSLTTKSFPFPADVVSVVYTMERNCVFCYDEINELLNLKRKLLEGLDLSVNVFVALDQPAVGRSSQLLNEVSRNSGDIWRQLGMKNGHIYVFDRCGQLAYEVISPWSKQSYPFTGMAILSAYSDNPCGNCTVSNQAFEQSAPVIEDSQEEYFRSEAIHMKRPRIPVTIAYRENLRNAQGKPTVHYTVVKLNSHTGVLPVIPKRTNLPVAGRTEAPTGEHSSIQLRKHYKPLMKWMGCAKRIIGNNKKTR